MCLTCCALAPFQRTLSYETRSFCHCGSPHSILQLALSLQFPVQSAPPHLCILMPCQGSSSLSCQSPISAPPTSLGECFFNSLVVRVPCSLIFWHFWLFIVFRFVVLLLLIVQESKAFLPTPPSQPELQYLSFNWCVQTMVKGIDIVGSTSTLLLAVFRSI